MNIVVGGATGFVGRALVPALIAAGHSVTVVGRDISKINSLFADKVTGLTWNKLSSLNPNGYHAIINLAGANVGGSRWSDAYKNEMLASRADSIKQCIDWSEQGAANKPHLYVTSGFGIYGTQDETPETKLAYTEKSNIPLSGTFLNELANQIESAGNSATVPVTIMRFGVVLGRGEGMLKQLETPTKMGMGAVVGSGKQPISWIDIDDLVTAILFLIAHPQLKDDFNLTAPEFVSQKEFTKTLAKVFHRPAFLWMPPILVKMIFGQMGEELLLSGQAVYPERLLDAGFKFQYPTLKEALEHEYRTS